MEGDAALMPGMGSPAVWHIAFKTTSRYWWARALACGRYKHVMCFGYVREVDGWLFYDFGPNACVVAVVPDGQANAVMGPFIDDAVVLRWVAPLVVREMRLKAAYVCTTAVAHLTGVPSSALRPDRFLRDCLAAGATIVVGEDELQKQQPSARSRVGAREGSGAR